MRVSILQSLPIFPQRSFVAHSYLRSIVTLTRLGRAPHNQISLDRSPNIGPLVSRCELDKFKNC
jgi:hypothetical protein